MIFNAIYFSIFMPLYIQAVNMAPSMVAKPYVVKALIDSAQIIGLPSSRAARDYAKRIQIPDPALQQIIFMAEPISARRLFFREYFRGV
ncbi:hypothetical protein LZG75_12035 [Polynucleobacter sp. IMCC30063]|uniref:hypothetical protein n=1 Tax=Polynucleobacter sp. IMCC30063 TaxID=2907298 RepID=UPI001F48DB2E|nr:hypothetical protein [Polynucleobacter sp. IMCC30063]MCE7506958.1 hypothetical protein [Polynucleobacter sp. IMCC30063]